MRVYIIRHTSVQVPRGICYGQTDVDLKVTFDQEAAVVKQNLESLTFDAIYTSPLSRCTRLADYCGYRDAIRDDRLKEVDFGDWEWQYLYSMTDIPEVQYWFANQLTARPPKGESFRDVQQRFLSFVEEKKAEGQQQIAAFAHGGIHLSAMEHLGTRFEGDIFSHLPGYGSVIPYDF
ncbi:MAG: alpha-ribazole phosphatase [Bacteroidetes bacterium]|nr:MAG: alpha-ribazole phosphatase [Bacteroidota bacterium]